MYASQSYLGSAFSGFLYTEISSLKKHSPIAPSRLDHGFGIPKRRMEVCSSTQLSRNYSLFKEEYGKYGEGDINSTCMKEVLIYGSLNKMEYYPELAGILNLFRESVGYSYTAHFVCPNKCAIGLRVGMEKEHFVNKDVVLFGMLPKNFVGQLDFLSTIKPTQGQTWIYYSTETPLRVLRWVQDMKLKDIRYHKLMTYHMDSEMPRPFGYFVENHNSNVTDELPNFAKNKTRLIAWMASNCEEIFWSRSMLVEHLMEHVHIDIYGRCGGFSLRCMPRDSDKCNWMLSKYKFYLALANSECRHYITEKTWRTALQHNIVPIIYGAPKVDIERFAPPNSYIHISDFPSIAELANYLQILDKNDTLYNKFFEWKLKGRVVSNFPPRPSIFCDMLSNSAPDPIATQESKKPCLKGPSLKSLGTSSWWRTCRYDVDMTTAVYTKNPKLAVQYKKWKPWNVTDFR
ncbi:alpha-(1,3)-fucosyltransferase 4-like [Amphiura filiformis]|uniref:alpha-(1,3)-fucosyltransferase 4-like n=1 Tax=Amphiura filiformis TaxID=82378 RepID=UPI003B21904D